MKHLFAFLILGALCFTGCIAVSYQQLQLPEGVTLAQHQTVAQYDQLVEEPCRHMTAQCPDACDHGGVYAVFSIKEYMDYQQFSREGEERQKTFAVRLWMRDGTPAPETSKALRYTIGELEAGQTVTLHWAHFYRITESGNFPERIVTLLAE